MRTFFAVVLLVCIGVCEATNARSVITAVVNRLKDMADELTKGGEEDEKIHDELACWCTTNEREKTEAISDAQTKITELNSTIEELSAKSSQLNVEIGQGKKDIADNVASLAKATAIRAEERKAFNDENNDAIQAVGALKGAITVLSKHNALNQESLLSLGRVMKNSSYSNILDPSDKDQLSAFLQNREQPYAAQSGEIFGILKQMKESMEKNMTDSEAAESKAREEFKSMRAAKEEEIRSQKKQLSDNQEELAETDEDNSNAKEDLDDTSKSLGADQQFMMDLKNRCSLGDKEWEERQKARAVELTAVNETIEILTNDAAHAQISSAGDSASFIQQKSSLRLSRRDRAARVLARQAEKRFNPEMSMLATAVQLDAFTKVKKAIDGMIADLGKQQTDEVQKKDECNTNIDNNEADTAKAQNEKVDLQNAISNLESKIETLANDIATIKKKIDEVHVEMQKASEGRKKENHEFQKMISDQRAMQAILKKAKERMSEVYAKASFAQVSQPAGFNDYKKNAGAHGVLSMLDNIIGDSKNLVSDAVKSEQDAQTTYEEFVKASTDSVESFQKQLVNKSEVKATSEGDLTNKKADLTSNTNELNNLQSESQALHEDCDFVLKNFDARQEARNEEMTALREAKSILAGSMQG